MVSSHTCHKCNINKMSPCHQSTLWWQKPSLRMKNALYVIAYVISHAFFFQLVFTFTFPKKTPLIVLCVLTLIARIRLLIYIFWNWRKTISIKQKIFCFNKVKQKVKLKSIFKFIKLINMQDFPFPYRFFMYFVIEELPQINASP